MKRINGEVYTSQRVVLANGCFDVFHVGHVRHLAAARAMGDRLIVSLTVDYAVNKGPGRPINTWEERAEVLRACRYVDEVVPSSSAVQAILKVRPTVFVKGIDYENNPILEVDRIACLEVGAELFITKTLKLGSVEIMRRMIECGF